MNTKGKDKAFTLGTIWTRVIEGGMQRFINRETLTRYTDVISHWDVLTEKPVKLEDFSNFEIIILVEY